MGINSHNVWTHSFDDAMADRPTLVLVPTEQLEGSLEDIRPLESSVPLSLAGLNYLGLSLVNSALLKARREDDQQ